jgi:hypothetical protein
VYVSKDRQIRRLVKRILNAAQNEGAITGPRQKRWRAGDHIERWVGSGSLVAERQFHKVQGYREIPGLMTSMANAVAKKAVAEEVKVA